MDTLLRDLEDSITLKQTGTCLRMVETVEAEPIPEPAWKTGTDLRNSDGYYRVPGTEDLYPSVSTILRMVRGDGYSRAEHLFAAREVKGHTQTLRHAIETMKTRAEVLGVSAEVWDNGLKEMILRPVLDILEDDQWMQHAGPRGMTRESNRGKVAHDALEEWSGSVATGREPNITTRDGYLYDWVCTCISAKNFAHPLADVAYPYVHALVLWLERNVKGVGRTEAPGFHKSLAYAGTSDLYAVEIEGRAGLGLLDLKTRSDMQPRAGDKYQLAAYNHFEYWGDAATGTLREYEPCDWCANLYVTPDDRKKDDDGEEPKPEQCRAVFRPWERGLDTAWRNFGELRRIWQDLYQIDADLTSQAPIVKSPRNPLAAMPTKRGRKVTTPPAE